MTNTIKHFLAHLDAPQRARFAAIAGTSVGHVYQLSSRNRVPLPQAAERLVVASEEIGLELGIRPLKKEEICPHCSGCRYLK